MAGVGHPSFGITYATTLISPCTATHQVLGGVVAPQVKLGSSTSGSLKRRLYQSPTKNSSQSSWPQWCGGKGWTGKLVMFYSDNESVVTILNSLSCRNKALSHLLKCIVFIVAKHSFLLMVAHILGRDNCLADAISRKNIGKFLSQAPLIMSRKPAPIPSNLPELININAPDWFSPNWIQQFKSFMPQV